MLIRWAVGIMASLVYLAAGFYPFNWVFRADNFNNEWTKLTPGGYIFSGPGISYLETIPELVQKAIDDSFIEIDLEIKTAHKKQYGPARIFTISENNTLRNLTIGQEGEDLVVRMRNPDTSLNGLPSYLVKRVFSSSTWHRIRVSITASALTIHVDETTTLHVALPDKAFSQWDSTYKLALGNELTFDRPWLGTIRHAIVRVKEGNIDYALPGLLKVPECYEIPRNIRPVFQTLLRGSGAGSVSDYTINLFGFIPYGFLIFYVNPRRSWVFAASLCLGMSLTIEFGQLLVVTDRVPSLVDVALNTLGGMFGAWLGENYLSRITKG